MDSATQGRSDLVDTVLGEVNTVLSSTYELVRPLEGGFQSGAWLIEDDSGQQAVLKWTPNRSWAEQIQRASRAVTAVRAHGYPTPAWLAVGTTGSGVGYQVQEFVAGRPREHLTEETARSAVDVLEVQHGLDPDPERSWSAYVTSRLRDGWASTIADVAATGVAGTGLATHAQELLDRYQWPVFPTSDLVHGDFRLGNLLFDNNTVSGVIDIGR